MWKHFGWDETNLKGEVNGYSRIDLHYINGKLQLRPERSSESVGAKIYEYTTTRPLGRGQGVG